MGNYINYIRDWWWGGDPDVPDPITGITLRNIYLVRKSWRTMYATKFNSGSMVMKRLFRADPLSKKFFSLKNLSEDQLEECLQYRTHVHHLMTTFNKAIEKLHNPQDVIEIMHDLLKTVLLTILIDLKFDGETVDSWRRTMEFFTCRTCEMLNT